MPDSEAQIKKARAVYGATRHLRLSEIPPIDYTDRISLLTVAGGLRPVGVLEGEGLQLSPVKDAVINNGLFTSVTKAVWTVREPAPDFPRADLLAVLHRNRNREQPRSALWLCSTREDRVQLKGVQLTKAAAGNVLSYPACCVRASVNEDLAIDKAFLEALVANVGVDPVSIEKAIRDNVQVELPDEFGANVPKSTEEFPFIIHVACDDCLATRQSPSAKLNEAYKSFIQEVNLELHNAVVETSRLLTGFAHLEDKGEVIARVEALHRSLFRF